MTDETVFQQAAELPPGELRNQFLNHACEGDSNRRQRIEDLLNADSTDDSLLDRPTQLVETNLADSPAGRVGTQIGPYKLLEVLGEGGMGVVYVAERRKPIRTRVALKLIKPGMDSHSVIARFEAERQALALMDHPNIAKVLDAGTTENGQPYFVMEYIKGVPITDYCDENNLSTERRLDLFRQVCRAIQHSHQKGIIHRDIKPSNILVAEWDHQPVPKVIDFGVAKALNQTLTDKTLYTQHLNVLGTLQYMSPEQAKLNQRDIDTRSDIYSLGVVLYELLTGTPPLSHETLEKAAFDEMCRIIREEEPARPSQRFMTMDLKTASQVARKRSSEPATFCKGLRGDLDRIVMMSLSKERHRRYGTAEAFSEDIDRFLKHEPVQAVNPSFAYLFSKSVRRFAPYYAVLAAVLVALAGVSGSLFVGFRAAHNSHMAAVDANQRLSAEREKAEELLAVTVEMLIQSDPEKASGLIDQARNVLRESPAREYQIVKRFCNSFLFKKVPDGVPHFKRLVELSKQIHGDQSEQHLEALDQLALKSEDPGTAAQAIALAEELGLDSDSRRLTVLGALQYFRGDLSDAKKTLTRALELFSVDPKSTYHPWRVPHLYLSEIARAEGDFSVMDEFRQQGIKLLRQKRENHWYLMHLGTWGKIHACPHAEQREWALASVDESQFDDVGHLRSLMSSRINVLRTLGRHSEADKVIEASSGVALDSWAIAVRALLNAESMNPLKAKEYFEKNLAMGQQLDELIGVDIWSIPWRRFCYLITEFHHGNRDDASRQMREEATSLAGQFDGFDGELTDFEVALYIRQYLVYEILANESADLEQIQQLIARYRKECETQKIDYSVVNDDPDFLASLLLRRQKRYDESMELLESSLLKLSLAENEPTLWMEQLLFEMYQETGQVKRSIDFMRKSLQHREQTLHWNHPEHGLARYRYGKFLVRQELDASLAESYLVESKRSVSRRGLVPESIKNEIDSLLSELSNN